MRRLKRKDEGLMKDLWRSLPVNVKILFIASTTLTILITIGVALALFKYILT